jgi:hypothetical protein
LPRQGLAIPRTSTVGEIRPTFQTFGPTSSTPSDQFDLTVPKVVGCENSQ